MKVIIAGSRHINDMSALRRAIELSKFDITEIVSGGASGVDTLGEIYAAEKGIPVKRFPADWDKHGRSAGPIRNGEMAEYADALIAVWHGASRGTANMIKQASYKKLRIHQHIVERPRWTVGVTDDERVYIEDADFKHDARFYVDGDFYNFKQRLSYVQEICNKLNSTPTTTNNTSTTPLDKL